MYENKKASEPALANILKENSLKSHKNKHKKFSYEKLDKGLKKE